MKEDKKNQKELYTLTENGKKLNVDVEEINTKNITNIDEDDNKTRETLIDNNKRNHRIYIYIEETKEYIMSIMDDTIEVDEHFFYMLLRKVMEYVDKKKKVDGSEKKYIVEVVLKHFVNALKNDTRKEQLNTLLESGIISETIELVIYASKGKMQLNMKGLKKLFTCLLNVSCNIMKKKK
jgi:hypothetical protein